MTSDRRAALFEAFKNKQYRQAYARRSVPETLALQIRRLREECRWTQRQLGEYTGMKQAAISRLEDPDYESYTITTLTRLATAFDRVFIGRYASYGELIDWTVNLTPERLVPPNFGEETGALWARTPDATEAEIAVDSNSYTQNAVEAHALMGERRAAVTQATEGKYAAAA